MKFKGEDVRVVRVDGENYVVAKDLGEFIGYSRGSDPVKKHCEDLYIVKPVKLRGDRRTMKRVLVPTKGVLKLLDNTRLDIDEDKLTFIHKTLIPKLKEGEVAECEDQLRIKDRKISSQQARISELNNKIRELQYQVHSLEIENLALQEDLNDTEAYLDNARIDLENSGCIICNTVRRIVNEK